MVQTDNTLTAASLYNTEENEDSEAEISEGQDFSDDEEIIPVRGVYHKPLKRKAWTAQ